ncbi:hypothetical protein VitviT2T_017338 [Vitis vinifera]|uniref:Uncharacterized protein n=1 Tax=Vitis vinifera TaxID=29760 RepID=A0ABY9CUH8_VITVI|nr:hypothetical protein VitviT2T_017338 [Vitis vinifera]
MERITSPLPLALTHVKEDAEKWVNSIQDSKWGSEGSEAGVEKDWELHDNVPACFDWSVVVSGGEASYRVYIGSPVGVEVYTKEYVSNVEAKLKRWEIGEIASRIAQLYFGQYVWMSEAVLYLGPLSFTDPKMAYYCVIVLSVTVFCHILNLSSGSQTSNNSSMIAYGVRVVLDMGSSLGRMANNCISMAVSDFYSINRHYKTRLILHTRDSMGDPLYALSSG